MKQSKRQFRKVDLESVSIGDLERILEKKRKGEALDIEKKRRCLEDFREDVIRITSEIENLKKERREVKSKIYKLEVALGDREPTKQFGWKKDECEKHILFHLKTISERFREPEMTRAIQRDYQDGMSPRVPSRSSVQWQVRQLLGKLVDNSILKKSEVGTAVYYSLTERGRVFLKSRPEGTITLETFTNSEKQREKGWKKAI